MSSSLSRFAIDSFRKKDSVVRGLRSEAAVEVPLTTPLASKILDTSRCSSSLDERRLASRADALSADGAPSVTLRARAKADMISPTRCAASPHDVGFASNLVPQCSAMKRRSSAARSATRSADMNMADPSSATEPRSTEMEVSTSGTDLLIAFEISAKTWVGGRLSAPAMRSGSRPAVATATAAAPHPSASSCAVSAATIVAFVASVRPPKVATRRVASAWHAVTAVVVPAGAIGGMAACGPAARPVGVGTATGTASPCSHAPMCTPEGAIPIAVSCERSFATSAICSEVSAASSLRSAVTSARAAACAFAQRADVAATEASMTATASAASA